MGINLLLGLSIFVSAMAQDDGQATLYENVTKPKEESQNKIEYITPNSEIRAAVQFLSKVPVQDQSFIKFLTTYSIPTSEKIRIDLNGNGELETISMREAVGSYVLPFWIHSMSHGHVFRHPLKVTDTLYAIDIRDYDWTNEGFEKVAIQDPYFRKPVIDQVSIDFLRLHSGNSILRADWFIAHTCDVTKQDDLGIEDPLYYELMYSNTGGAPKNLKEFQKVWGVDLKTVEDLGILTGTIVDSGISGVSRNNRQLLRAKTLLGYYWETEDVLNMEQRKDYIENLDPGFRKAEDKDAAEAIASNFLGLQVYLLADGKGDRVEFGDPTAVIDHTDPYDKRVRTARSCVICHPKGINEPTNSIKGILDKGVELRFIDTDVGIEYESFYFNPFWKDNVKDDIELYTRAVKLCTGVEPETMATMFDKFNQWYDRPLNMWQVAQEIGQDKELVQNRLIHSASGRISKLVTGGNIPRSVWDNPKNTIYAQAMLLVYNIKVPINNLLLNQNDGVILNHDNRTNSNNKLLVFQSGTGIITVDTDVKVKGNVVGRVTKGTRVQIQAVSKKDNGKWSLIKSGNIRGYIFSGYIKRDSNKSQTERLRDIQNKYLNDSS